MTSGLVVQGAVNEFTHDLKATYGGDANNVGSTSVRLSVTVLNAADVVFRNGYETESLSCPIE